MKDCQYYPITIVQARYGGTYEGAEWLAFNRYPENLPEDWDGDDMSCNEFWTETREFIGKGGSPQLAYTDLLEKLKERADIIPLKKENKMSYDISLLTPCCGCIGHLLENLGEQGGTYIIGGTTNAELNVTFNYANHFNFRGLDGREAKLTIPELEEVVEKLGTERASDYWSPTTGNVGYACSLLLKMAKDLPTHIWEVNA